MLDPLFSDKTYRQLILDEHTTKLMSGVVKVSDLLDHGIAGNVVCMVWLQHSCREIGDCQAATSSRSYIFHCTNTGSIIVLFVLLLRPPWMSSQKSSTKHVAASPSTQPYIYSSQHVIYHGIYITPDCPDPLIEVLSNSKAMKFIKTLKELNLDFTGMMPLLSIHYSYRFLLIFTSKTRSAVQSLCTRIWSFCTGAVPDGCSGMWYVCIIWYIAGVCMLITRRSTTSEAQ